MVPATYPTDANGNMIVAYVDPAGRTPWVDYIPVGSLLNGSFETGDETGWSGNGSAQGTVVNTQSFAGDFSLEVSLGVGGPDSISVRYPVSPGDTVYYSCRAKPVSVVAETPSGLSCRFYDNIANLTGNQIGTGQSIAVNVSIEEFQHLFGSAVAPSGSAAYALNCGGGSPDGTGAVYFDQVCAGLESEKNRFEENGWIPVNVLSSTSGLTAWVDYLPAVFINNENNAKRWTTDAGGFVPIVEMSVA